MFHIGGIGWTFLGLWNGATTILVADFDARRGARPARARARDERRLRAHHPADALRRAGRRGTRLLGAALDRLRRLADHHPGPQGRAAHVPLPAVRRLRPDRDDGRRRPARAGGPRPRRPARAPAALARASRMPWVELRVVDPRPAAECAARRGRRGLDARAERHGGLLQPSGGDGRGADRRTAGCGRATAATSTTRATSSSPTGSRTWSSAAGRTCTRSRSRRRSSQHPGVAEVDGHRRAGRALGRDGQGARRARAGRRASRPRT